MTAPFDLEQAMAALRSGHEIQIGGGRCFTTYLLRDDQLVVIDFDEGHIEEQPCSEETLRAVLARTPDTSRHLLKRPATR